MVVKKQITHLKSSQMTTPLNHLLKSMVFASLLLSLSACTKNVNAPEEKPIEVPPVVVTKSSLKMGSNATFGSLLTDDKGKSLYFFSADANGTSSCNTGCETLWPAFYAEDVTVPQGMVATDIGTITRADGKKQTTFKGWPLYYYAADVNTGEVKGDGVGGNWFVAKPDYSIMLANTQLVGNDGKNYTADTKEGTGISQYLTDAAGRTLYAFAPDTFNVNTYTKADLSNNATWPIFESEILNLPSVISKTLVVQITSVGKKQLTFKGHPLYYFGPDAKRGQTKGVSVPAPGVWPILNLNSAALN
jgi:predicted lipoprotein with Yx(FWY)xxD motif